MQGATQRFSGKVLKVLYCHFLLKSKIDECDTATDVVKSVNILMAIRWVAKAWTLVNKETIQKCFRKAGIFSGNMDVATTSLEEDHDPFSECDIQEEMECLLIRPCLLREDVLK